MQPCTTSDEPDPEGPGTRGDSYSRTVAVIDELAPTGVLRASINLGNPVLAQGTAADPRGVTVDLARDLAATLDLPVSFSCFDAARDSFAAVRDGSADIGFFAIEPARAQEIAFTAPYAVIESVFAARTADGPHTIEEVDQDGIRVGVKRGSAYDLYLTRTLRRARIERGDEGTAVTEELGLEVAAGIRTPMSEWVSSRPAWQVLEPSFMEIRQAVGVVKTRSSAVVDLLHDHVERRKADGFVADSLARSGRTDARVAPPQVRRP